MDSELNEYEIPDALPQMSEFCLAPPTVKYCVESEEECEALDWNVLTLATFPEIRPFFEYNLDMAEGKYAPPPLLPFLL